MVIASVRELFKEDEKFRGLVTSYLYEFERLLAWAGDADRRCRKAYLLFSRAVDRLE